MKTNKFFSATAAALILVATLALSACNNEPGMKSALGDYSYRLSGAVRVYDGATDNACHVTLEPENGEMTIIRGNEPDQGVIQVFADNGDTYEMPVVFMHDTVHIEPMYRDIAVKGVFDSANPELFHVCIAGEGYLLNNGAITIHLGYTGRSRNTDHEYTLTAGDIHMNAKKR